MIKVTLELTQEEADALYEAVDGVHQECLGAADCDEESPVDDPDAVASLGDKIVAAFCRANVPGFR
jgi:hypothetical protein